MSASALTLAGLESKLETFGGHFIEHVRESVDMKGRLDKLEGAAKVDLGALKDAVLADVRGMLSDLRSEIVGDLKVEPGDSAEALGKAMADLTSAEADAPMKDDAKSDAPVADVVTPVALAPATPAGPMI